MKEAVITLDDVSFSYRLADGDVLRGVSLAIVAGEVVVIGGSSGSGKTTLAKLMGALLTPTSGGVIIAGESVSRLNEVEAARLRAHHIRVVPQNFLLLPYLTAIENLQILSKIDTGKPLDKASALELLARVQLSKSMGEKLPDKLSGGEQQRVAIARALVGRPKLIIADEPTGNLDSENRRLAVKLLTEAAAITGAALVVVTHESEVATQLGGRRIRIADGLIEPAGM